MRRVVITGWERLERNSTRRRRGGGTTGSGLAAERGIGVQRVEAVPVRAQPRDGSHRQSPSCQKTVGSETFLPSAVVQRSCKISESFEEYLGIFEEFYADDIEVDSETGEEPIRGKARVRSLIATFLVPLHIMAEIGGLLISIRQTAIRGDAAADETHSAWTLELVGYPVGRAP